MTDPAIELACGVCSASFGSSCLSGFDLIEARLPYEVGQIHCKRRVKRQALLSFLCLSSTRRQPGWIPVCHSPSIEVPRFDFEFVVAKGAGAWSLRLVTGAGNENEPCTTYATDLSGEVTNPDGGDNDEIRNFLTMAVTTSPE